MHAVIEDVRTFSKKEKAINKFKKAYFEEFGDNLSDQKAYDKFFGLVKCLRVVVGEKSESAQK